SSEDQRFFGLEHPRWKQREPRQPKRGGRASCGDPQETWTVGLIVYCPASPWTFPVQNPTYHPQKSLRSFLSLAGIHLLQQFRRQYNRLLRNRAELKTRNQSPGADRLDALLPAARPREQAHERLGRHAQSAEASEPRIAVALGKTAAVGSDDQRHMSKP